MHLHFHLCSSAIEGLSWYSYWRYEGVCFSLSSLLFLSLLCYSTSLLPSLILFPSFSSVSSSLSSFTYTDFHPHILLCSSSFKFKTDAMMGQLIECRFYCTALCYCSSCHSYCTAWLCYCSLCHSSLCNLLILFSSYILITMVTRGQSTKVCLHVHAWLQLG